MDHCKQPTENIQKEIEERQNKIGDTKALKKKLSQLSAPNDGVAKDFADAIKDGNFKKAQESLKSLADKLANFRSGGFQRANCLTARDVGNALIHPQYQRREQHEWPP